MPYAAIYPWCFLGMTKDFIKVHPRKHHPGMSDTILNAHFGDLFSRYAVPSKRGQNVKCAFTFAVEV